MTGAKLTPQEIGMLRKSMYGTRDTASNWEGDWQNHMQNRGTSWRQIPQHVNHDEGNISFWHVAWWRQCDHRADIKNGRAQEQKAEICSINKTDHRTWIE